MLAAAIDYFVCLLVAVIGIGILVDTKKHWKRQSRWARTAGLSIGLFFAIFGIGFIAVTLPEVNQASQREQAAIEMESAP